MMLEEVRGLSRRRPPGAALKGAAQMRKLTLGSTSLEVTPICHGCWQASPKFWGEQPRERLVAALRRAIDTGVNFIDTADAYGDGLSEEIVGEALAPFQRGQVIVATKVYHHFYPDGRRHPDLSHDYVLAECDASLKRLRMDYVDLYQLHSFDPLTHMEETTRALEKLKSSGKIRHYGVSNFTVEQLSWARRHGSYETLQPRFSLLHTEAEKDILPFCRMENIGVLVYSPLCNGLLTGKYNGAETFSDFRGKNPDFQGERFRKAAAAVQSLAPIASKYSATLTQLVLAATLATPLIDCAIVGIKTPEQIEEAAGAADIMLEREDYFAIRQKFAGLG